MSKTNKPISRKMKILCVEDEDRLRTDIKEELQDVGYEVLEAADGKQALTVLTEQQVDLVICDIMMPKMNGHELLTNIRQNHPSLDEVPFIFLTALSSPNDVVSGLGMGADDYLTKPIEFETMLARVGARLRQSQRMREVKDKELIKLYNRMSQSSADSPISKPIENERFVIELQALVQKPGRLGAGKVQFISIDPIKEKMGDRWPALEAKAFEIAESVIRADIGSTDLFSRYGNQGFVFLFPGLNEAECIVKTDAIASEIAHRLLGSNAELSAGFTLSSDALNPKDLLDETGTFDIERIKSDFDQVAHDNASQPRSSLHEQAIKGIQVKWLPVWNLKSKKVACYMAEYTRQTPYGSFEGAEVVHGGLANPFVEFIDQYFFKELSGGESSVISQHADRVYMLPIHWVSLRGKHTQTIFDAIERISNAAGRHRILLEIRAIPNGIDRALIEDQLRTLRTMAGGVGLRLEFPIQDSKPWGAANFLGMQLTHHDLHLESEVLIRAFSRLSDLAKKSNAHSYCTGVDEQNAAWLCMLHGVEMIVGRAVESLRI